MRPTAPRPVPRMFDQLSLHRIRVHVLQFLPPFLLAPHIEVVKSPLPKMRFRCLTSSERQRQLCAARSSSLLQQRPRGPQKRPPFVTAKRNEMQITFSVMSSQISRHQKKRTAHPFFQKGWGTLVSSPHGELRKWYPLLVPLRQAEKSRESNAPPASALNSWITGKSPESVLGGTLPVFRPIGTLPQNLATSIRIIVDGGFVLT